MSQINHLISNYQRFVSLPWQTNLDGSQRVWFAVYPPSEERRLRAHIQEFEVATQEAHLHWRLVDITSLTARWLAAQKYKDSYFAEPSALATISESLQPLVVSELRGACQAVGVDNKTVVAVLGAGGLFGFCHISSAVKELENSIQGRLLVFFPGEYERNLYRFMDARDGFNYMAVPITCTQNQINV